MRKSILAVGLTCIALLAVTSTAHAWNKAGHMVSGAIAYRDLKAHSPATLAKVVAILKQHPEFNSRFVPRLQTVPEDERDLYLFMLAARWPDDIRGTSYDRPAQHYIDFPYVPPGQPATINAPPPEPENLVTSFRQNVQVVEGAGPDADKAVALCWIFHLAGDVHMPLHDVSLFTTDYPAPEGDRGGTRGYIRARDCASTISLHQYWDDLILDSSRVRTVWNRATELALRPGSARANFPELAEPDVETWAKEGHDLAVEYVYRQGDITGSKDRANGWVLPEDYAPEVKPLAERRVVLSSYRLADTLRRILP